MLEQRVSDRRRGLDCGREIGNGSSGIHAFNRASLSVNIGDCIQNIFWQLVRFVLKEVRTGSQV